MGESRDESQDKWCFKNEISLVRDESQDKWCFKNEISLVAIAVSYVSASPHQTGQ